MNDTCRILGHDDEVTYEDDELIQYVCARCGAELDDFDKTADRIEEEQG